MGKHIQKRKGQDYTGCLQTELKSVELYAELSEP
jgi:hypothetical protein